MTKKQVTNWRIIIKNNDETVRDSRTTNYNRFAQFLCLGKELESKYKGQPLTYFIKADYGKHIDNFGDKVTFDNEGMYTSKQDALRATQAFQEVAREWEACND